ncbi:hypothetical protein E2C01_070464 [Portunus trituberculatus]|uniref:Uncharacterized protein n=1 Tax=Portunus trituberculatus TaxID=210409 RepID=A0A5B7I1D8_PORTR|nr:hypothetical protein [Portunus trituberculatus]
MCVKGAELLHARVGSTRRRAEVQTSVRANGYYQCERGRVVHALSTHKQAGNAAAGFSAGHSSQCTECHDGSTAL